MASFAQHFRIILEKIFNNWVDLRLAVEHGMGGRNGQQTAIEIMEYVYQYCIGNEDITPGELQNVIEDLMDQEFNTFCDDNSIPEICQNLVRYMRMLKEEKHSEVEAELSKLPLGKDWLRPDVKVTYTPVVGESSSDDDNEDDSSSDDMDVDKDESEKQLRQSSRFTRSSTKTSNFVEPEPGWTTVRTKK